jgi:hypothetical protein
MSSVSTWLSPALLDRHFHAQEEFGRLLLHSKMTDKAAIVKLCPWSGKGVVRGGSA